MIRSTLSATLAAVASPADAAALASRTEKTLNDATRICTVWDKTEHGQAEGLVKWANGLDVPDPQDAAFKQLAKWRRETGPLIEKEMLPLVRAADDQLATIAASIEYSKSPSHLFGRTGTGEADREKVFQYAALVANADVGTLVNQIRTAVKTGNRELAFACMQRVEQLPEAKRKAIPFSYGQVANHFDGKRHAELMITLRRAQIAAMKTKAAWATLKDWSESKLQTMSRVNGQVVNDHSPIGTWRSQDKVTIGLEQADLDRLISELK